MWKQSLIGLGIGATAAVTYYSLRTLQSETTGNWNVIDRIDDPWMKIEIGHGETTRPIPIIRFNRPSWWTRTRRYLSSTEEVVVERTEESVVIDPADLVSGCFDFAQIVDQLLTDQGICIELPTLSELETISFPISPVDLYLEIFSGLVICSYRCRRVPEYLLKIPSAEEWHRISSCLSSRIDLLKRVERIIPITIHRKTPQLTD